MPCTRLNLPGFNPRFTHSGRDRRDLVHEYLHEYLHDKLHDLLNDLLKV
jgi:hypothetical protein